MALLLPAADSMCGRIIAPQARREKSRSLSMAKMLPIVIFQCRLQNAYPRGV
jgi:hypothetical protein